MKKLRFTFILLFSIAIIIGITCCNNEIPNEGRRSKVANSQILKELDEFNSTLPTTGNITRGISKVQWGCVIGADALGAWSGFLKGASIGACLGPKGAVAGGILGGVINGAATSVSTYMLARQMNEFLALDLELIPDPNFEPSLDSIKSRLVFVGAFIKPEDYELGLNLGFDSTQIETGIQHNYIVSLLVEDNQLEYEYTLSELPELERSIIESEEFVAEYNNMPKTPEEFYFDENSVADCIMKKLYQAISNTKLVKNNVNTIIRVYKNKIENTTELTENEKESLLQGLSVMRYSFEYWSKHPDFDENSNLPTF